MGHRLLLRNPELYHGRKGSRPYFEGWYFKQASEQGAFSVIPGVFRGVKAEDDFAFIQAIFGSPSKSYFVRYSFGDFLCRHDPFEVRIGDNLFSLTGVELNIKDIGLTADMKFTGRTPIETSYLSPSIMGYYSYFPAMQCNHGVLSLRHIVNGSVNCGEMQIAFNDACGYIEKDWGEAFPQSWIWMQCCDMDSSLMCATASIPYGPFRFNGLICVLEVDGGQHRFATYNRAKLESLDTGGGKVSAVIKRKETELRITANGEEFGELIAPSTTGMDRLITESICVRYSVEMLREGVPVFSRQYKNGGLELYNADKLFIKADNISSSN